MTSQRQIEANRANAKHSTGPKSTEGKSVAAKNAIKHGLLAKDAVLPDENYEDYLSLLSGLTEEFQPSGVIETSCVGRIANSLWRLERIGRLEAGLYILSSCQAAKIKIKEQKEQLETSGFDVMDMGRPIITDENAYAAADASLLEIEKAESAPNPSLAEAFSYAGQDDSFMKLARYEKNIEKTLFGTLQELRRIQSLRKNESPKDQSLALSKDQ